MSLFKPQRQAFAIVSVQKELLPVLKGDRGSPKSCDPSDPLRNIWMREPSVGLSTLTEVKLNPCYITYSHLERSLVWNFWLTEKNDNKIPRNYVQLCSFLWGTRFHYNWLLKPGFWRGCDIGEKFLMTRDVNVLRKSRLMCSGHLSIGLAHVIRSVDRTASLG